MCHKYLALYNNFSMLNKDLINTQVLYDKDYKWNHYSKIVYVWYNTTSNTDAKLLIEYCTNEYEWSTLEIENRPLNLHIWDEYYISIIVLIK